MAAIVFMSFMTGCACDSLWADDTPRPELATDDRVTVDPACPGVSFDTGAVAPVQSIVVVTGRRKNNGLGAEGVPVDVSVGPCNGGEDAGSGKDSGAGVGGAPNVEIRDASTGSAKMPANAGGGKSTEGASEPSGAARESMACSRGLKVADSSLAIVLLQSVDSTCTELSTSRLQCRLDANGVARFGIVGKAAADAIVSGYLPVCVGPSYAEGPMPIEVRAKPSSLKQPVLRVVQAGDWSPEPPPSGTDCTALRTDAVCSSFRTLPLTVGAVSPDLPLNAIGVQSFVQVQRRLSLDVELGSPQGRGGSGFLSFDRLCHPADASEGLSLPIEAQQRQSQIFYLCARSDDAMYSVTATATDDASLTGSSDVIQPPPVLKSLAAMMTHGSVLATYCSGLTETAALTATALSIPGLGALFPISPSNCPMRPTSPEAGPRDGGPKDASAPVETRDASPAPEPMCTSATVTFSLAASCELPGVLQ